MRWDSVSDAKVRSTQLSSGLGDGVAGIGVGVGVGAAVGLLVGVGVGVGLPVGVGVAVGNGDAAPDAKRHPESTAATSGSVTIGPVRRVLRREVTTTSTRELAETWMTVRRLVFVRPWPAV